MSDRKIILPDTPVFNGPWWNSFLTMEGASIDGRHRFKLNKYVLDVSSNAHTADKNFHYIIIHVEKTSMRFHEELSLFFQAFAKEMRPTYDINFERNKFYSNTDISFRGIPSNLVPTVFEQVMNRLDQTYKISEPHGD